MKKSKLNKKRLGLSGSKGFTLIEVVLVLAIGGLIFLLAFLAFQQTSRNRRDTQRRSDAGRVIAELQNYLADTSSFPDSSTALTASTICTTTTASSFGVFLKDYVCDGTSFKGPGGANYTTITPATLIAKDAIKYTKDATCASSSASGSVKVEIGLDNGAAYCRDIK